MERTFYLAKQEPASERHLQIVELLVVRPEEHTFGPTIMESKQFAHR